MAKQLSKIIQGREKDREVTWFPELVDKRITHDLYSSVKVIHHCIVANGKEHQNPPVLGHEELWWVSTDS